MQAEECVTTMQVGDTGSALELAKQMREHGAASGLAARVLKAAAGPAQLWQHLLAAAPDAAWEDAQEVQVLMQQQQTQRLLPLVTTESADSSSTAAQLPGLMVADSAERLDVPPASLVDIEGKQHVVLKLPELDWCKLAQQVRSCLPWNAWHAP